MIMTPHYNFLLVSKRDDKDGDRIITELERNRLYRVSRVDSALDSIGRLARGGAHCLVLNYDSLEEEQLKVIRNIRGFGHVFPIIIFAGDISTSTYDLVKKFKRVNIIEKPFDPKDVWGICQKMLQGRPVSQRIFRRYLTNQNAAIEKTVSGENFDGSIYNLSRGGAYLELDDGRLTPGDLLRLTIQLDTVERSYNVDAEVVWSSPKGFAAGKPAAGLRFVRAGDVYRNLLNKI